MYWTRKGQGNFNIRKGYKSMKLEEAILDFDESRPQDFINILVADDTTKQLKITSCFKNTNLYNKVNFFTSI